MCITRQQVIGSREVYLVASGPVQTTYSLRDLIQTCLQQGVLLSLGAFPRMVLQGYLVISDEMTFAQIAMLAHDPERRTEWQELCWCKAHWECRDATPNTWVFRSPAGTIHIARMACERGYVLRGWHNGYAHSMPMLASGMHIVAALLESSGWINRGNVWTPPEERV